MPNKNNIFKIQKKISFLFFTAGMIVSINNFIYYLPLFGLTGAITTRSVSIFFLVSCIMFLTALWDLNILRHLQLLLIVLIAITNVLDDHDSIYGLGLLFMTIFISFKYGYFRTWFKTKAVTLLVLTSVLMIYSSRINNEDDETWVYGLNIIIYIMLFFLVTYIIYSDNLKKYIDENKATHETIETLNNEKNSLLEKLQQLDSRITKISDENTPLDMQKYSITPAEQRVIEILVIYRATDKEIAEKLNLSYHTVKNHFRSIRNKLGVDRRDEIIELCRYNFLEYPHLV